jgi:hypothetical protein
VRTPKALLRRLDERDGHVSAWSGIEYQKGDDDPLVPQHRQGGMGGGKRKHRLSNVVWLESWRNQAIEDDADAAQEARDRGIKISIHANPQAEPIQHAIHGLCLLDDDGSVHPRELVF